MYSKSAEILLLKLGPKGWSACCGYGFGCVLTLRRSETDDVGGRNSVGHLVAKAVVCHG